MKGSTNGRRTPAQCRNDHISQTKEVAQFREAMISNLPAWREEKIREAHRLLLRRKMANSPHLRHPVRIGDLP